MTAKRELASSVYAAEQDIDSLFRPFGPAIEAIVVKHAVETADGPRLDSATRIAILRDVDRLLDTVFPKLQGGPSRLEDLIEARANEARFKPIGAAVAHMRTRLKDQPRLLKAMGDGAAD